MRGHGVIVTGETVPWATYAALTLERVLHIQSIARSLGNLRPMTPEMADRVYPDKYRDASRRHLLGLPGAPGAARRPRRRHAWKSRGRRTAMLEPFTIHQPQSVAEASALLRSFGDDAAVYAGGTELLIVMKERLAYFPHLIDIKRIPGLSEIDFDAERREI